MLGLGYVTFLEVIYLADFIYDKPVLVNKLCWNIKAVYNILLVIIIKSYFSR